MKWRSLEESTFAAETRSLSEIFVERKQLIAQYVPAEIQALHARAIADLQAQRIVDQILPVGAQAPSFELRDQNDQRFSSTELLRRHRLVICFIRGRWCPFCVGQLEAMNRILPEFERVGASLVAISPQTLQQSFFMHDQHKLRFTLLSDPGNQLARQFGLVYRVPDAQRAVYRRAFINLPVVNGDESWELPIPATYIIDRDSAVRYASADPDYTARPEPADILQVLRGGR